MRSSSCFTSADFRPALSGVLKYRTAMALISPIFRALTSPSMSLSFATADGALSMRAAAASELLADLSLEASAEISDRDAASMSFPRRCLMRAGSFANPQDERMLPTASSLRLVSFFLAPSPNESRTTDDMA